MGAKALLSYRSPQRYHKNQSSGISIQALAGLVIPCNDDYAAHVLWECTFTPTAHRPANGAGPIRAHVIHYIAESDA